MKIRYYNRSLSPGARSIEKVFNEIANNISRLGCEVGRYHCPKTGAKLDKIFFNLLSARNFRRKEEIAHITGDVTYLGIALEDCCTVITYHDLVTLKVMSGAKREIARLLWFDIPTRYAKRVTCISGFTKNQLLAAVPELDPRKISVIHNPISADYFWTPLKPMRRRPRLLQIGTGRHNKNLEGVAKAIEGIDCELHIVGRLDNNQQDMLESLGIDYYSQYNLEEIQLVDCYQQADIIVFASKYEGFGLPIIEAQAIGRPVVTSNLCSMPEIAGGAALLVDPFDSRGIREAILTLVENQCLRKELVEKGLENVKRFDRRVIAELYMEEYQRAWLER
jgi:glycosyltransferase involved in cell wall biosynthesis